MELWIRSQDKHSLMMCKRITIVDIKENYVINADNGTWDYDIGIYKTKERALEVLDEIQKYILLPNTDGSAYVYEMPKE